MNKDKKSNDKFYSFLESYGILTIISIILTLLSFNKILLTYSEYGIHSLEFFFTTTLKETLEHKDSTLITIAAVFIGIYFTVFTLLSSIKVDSTFSILTKKNFESLLIYIRNAFIGSFIYLFYSLFSTSISNDWFFTIIALTLLLYMLLSALRFGMIIYLIFSRDVKKYYNELENEKQKKRELENLYKRLELFLDREEAKEEKRYHDKFAQKLHDKLKK